jgi:hypothetical protein
MEKKAHYIIGDTMRYAQGPISAQYKDVLKQRIEQVESEAEFEKFLTDSHDAMLICQNDPNGLRAAVKFLISTSLEPIVESK